MKKLRHRTIAKQHCDSLKIDKGCAICGYSRIARALDFHHIAGKKGKNVSQLQGKAMFREMKKCVVLCATCHREVTAGVHSLKPLYRHIITQDDLGFMEGDWDNCRLGLFRDGEVKDARGDLVQFGSREDRRKTAMKIALKG